MNFNELTSGKVSTGKSAQPSLLPPEAHTPPYAKSEAKINRLETQDNFLAYGRKYAESFHVKLALTLQQALELRQHGVAAITLREADIAARWKVNLDSKFIQDGIRKFDGLLTEGLPGEKDNPFALREFYNRGVNFKKNGDYDRADSNRRKIADQAMADALSKLNSQDLPAWPEEIENGFNLELCKPEFMTWEQYREAAKTQVFRQPEFSNEGDSHDSETIDQASKD